MTFDEDRAQQLAAISRYLGSDAPDKDVMGDLFDDAVQAVIDYTGRTQATMTHSLMIAAKAWRLSTATNKATKANHLALKVAWLVHLNLVSLDQFARQSLHTDLGKRGDCHETASI
jgi:hypothetical protein